jgi:hypothetical protein
VDLHASFHGGSGSALGFRGTSARSVGPVVVLSLWQGPECAGVGDERVHDGRGVKAVDAPYDDPVVAGGMFATISHSRLARASVSSGAPWRPGSHSRSAKRSAPARVARVTNRSWWRPSTVTPKRPMRRMRDQVSGVREGQKATSGG